MKMIFGGCPTFLVQHFRFPGITILLTFNLLPKMFQYFGIDFNIKSFDLRYKTKD